MYGSGDSSIAGQTVTLYVNGVPYVSTTTSSTGSYFFGNLPNGSYTIGYTNATTYSPAVANLGTMGGIISGPQVISAVVLSGGQQSLWNNFGLIPSQGGGGSTTNGYAGGGMGTYPTTPIVPTTPTIPTVPTTPTSPSGTGNIPLPPSSGNPMVPVAPHIDDATPTTTPSSLMPSKPCVIANAWNMTCEFPHTGVDTRTIMTIIYSLIATLALAFGIYIVRRRA